MQNLNRRQWLKTAGLATGALSVLGPAAAARVPNFSDYLQHREMAHMPPGVAVKLSSNENPYGPSKNVREAMTSAFDDACRYPWEERVALTKKLAEKEGVTPEHILITVGSTEGLKITALTYALNGEIVTADPTFEAMLYYAENFGAHINRVPVDGNFVADLDTMERHVTNKTSLVFLCNPNNPTGTIVAANKLRDFCETVSRRALVFSDEAYYDYITEPGYPSMLELVKKGRNVVVSRTFSKVYGLAGIRIGYLIARPGIIEYISHQQVERPNMLALHAASRALGEQDFYSFSLQKNAEAKRMIYDTLGALRMRYVPSHTNFVFFETGREISEVQAGMLKQGIRVGRPFPPFRKWCRVSTGKIEEVAALQQGLMRVFG
jgi:histidinol-phosphate aminotransferase